MAYVAMDGAPKPRSGGGVRRAAVHRKILNRSVCRYARVAQKVRGKVEVSCAQNAAQGRATHVRVKNKSPARTRWRRGRDVLRHVMAEARRKKVVNFSCRLKRGPESRLREGAEFRSACANARKVSRYKPSCHVRTVREGCVSLSKTRNRCACVLPCCPRVWKGGSECFYSSEKNQPFLITGSAAVW